MKTQGQLDYEEDVRNTPNYPNGTPRATWEQLGALSRYSWDRKYNDRNKIANDFGK
jgi:hypothetical protein